jgi:hypothetical protein
MYIYMYIARDSSHIIRATRDTSSASIRVGHHAHSLVPVHSANSLAYGYSLSSSSGTSISAGANNATIHPHAMIRGAAAQQESLENKVR